MKKMLIAVVIMFIAMTVTAQSKTVYLNSKAAACTAKGVTKECLQYRFSEQDSTWSIYSGSIKGFTYTPGYFYTLRVRPLKLQQWQLVKVISKTKATVQQPGDTVVALSKPPAELIGRWNFTKLLNDVSSPAFTKEFLVFDASEMRVNGKASCNGFFGNYTADTSGNKKEIHFAAIGHTMMACENLVTENKMLAAMEKVTGWSREGDKLYLKANSITLIELTRVAEGVM